MEDSTLRVAVISADPTFRSAVAEVLRSHPELAAVISDQTVAASSLTASSIDRIHAENPEVVLVDLADDPATGMRMVRVLGDAGPARTLIATGPLLTPELLLDGMKAGIAEYLPSPVDAHELADSLRRAARRLGRGKGYTPGANGRVVTFVGSKGGTGVTTLAANFALLAHQQVPKQRTLLLDLNLEGGNLAVATGLSPRYSVVDLLENFHRVDESLLTSLVTPHDSGVHLLAAPLLPESVPAVSADQARAVFRLLRRYYDLVVVDVARPYSEYGRATIEHSDVVCLMLVPDVLAIHGAKRLLPLIRKGVEGRRGQLRVVLNRAAAEDEIQKKDIEDALDIKVAQVLRRDDANVMSSLNLGRPATTNGSRSRYAHDVQALCTSLTVAPARGQPSRVGRLFHRLSRGKA